MISLDAIQPTYEVPALETIPDDPEDAPALGLPLTPVSPNIPPIVFGAGALSAQYNADDHLRSDVPFRTVRLALRYGINAFDTSAYYGASELVLGSILRALAPEFPRESYKLMSKCGRYGPEKENFDYSPNTIRRSVLRSLERLGTPYLDSLCLHDIEFVANPVHPADPTGDSLTAIHTESGQEAWGLRKEDEGKVHGTGDESILAAFEELRKLKSEGLVRAIGITGYPLPTLLRIAILINAHFHEPMDVLLSYSHYTLQNNRFADFAPEFKSRAHIGQLYCASPLNMGFFTPNVPWWSPAPPGMLDAREQANVICQSNHWEDGLANLALGYGMRRSDEDKAFGRTVPTVVGFSKTNEVHEAVKVWREIFGAGEVSAGKRRGLEESVVRCFVESGWSGWSWASG